MKIIIDNKVIDKSIVDIKDVNGTSIAIKINSGETVQFHEGELGCCGAVDTEGLADNEWFEIDLSRRQTRLLYDIMKQYYGDK